MNIQNQTIENKEIVVKDKDNFNAIGADAILKNCRVKLSVPSSSIGVRGQIIGGSIHTTRELSGFDWLEVKLDGVKFTGKFKNNRFGVFPRLYEHGEIKNCDFSEATLKDALFLNTSCEGVVFPRWPHVTFFNNEKMSQSIALLKGRDNITDFLNFLKDYIQDYGGNEVKLEAMVINSEQVAKAEGFSTDEFKLVLASIEGIQY